MTKLTLEDSKILVEAANSKETKRPNLLKYLLSEFPPFDRDKIYRMYCHYSCNMDKKDIYKLSRIEYTPTEIKNIINSNVVYSVI